MDADEADWADAVLAGSGPLSPEEAAAVLRLPPDVWVDAAATAAAAKSAFRRLCIRWHPDKHSGEEAKQRATALFVRIAAAYNTLTTTNFDFSRWASTFSIPSLQTLDDVLALALGGADPQVVDAMLRKRGDYRPHARFGVDLAVPWTAGGREQACWDMAGAAHSTTRALEGGGGGRGPADELTLALRELSFEEAESSVAPERVVGGSAERPWERVGAEPGAWGSSAGGAAKQQPQLQPPLRPDLQPGEAASARAADTLNDWGLAAFAAGAAGAAATAFTEAARLHPTAAAYPANLAAALLRCGDARRAADAARACLRLQPLHGRALVRLGSALLKIAESPYVGDRGRAELREARGAFAEAVRVCPESGEARRGLREAELAWAAEFDSDEE